MLGTFYHPRSAEPPKPLRAMVEKLIFSVRWHVAAWPCTFLFLFLTRGRDTDKDPLPESDPVPDGVTATPTEGEGKGDALCALGALGG